MCVDSVGLVLGLDLLLEIAVATCLVAAVRSALPEGFAVGFEKMIEPDCLPASLLSGLPLPAATCFADGAGPACDSNSSFAFLW